MKRLSLLLVLIVAAVVGLGRLTQASFVVGNTAIGASLDSGDSNYLNGSRITTGGDGGTVSSVSLYVGSVDASPNNQYQVAVYADNSNKPGALLATSVVGTLTANAWNTVQMATAATLQPSTSYWLMFNTNGRTSSVNNMRYDAGSAGAGAYSTGSVNFPVWPSSFGSSVLSDAAYSIYATLDNGIGPPPESIVGSWSSVATWPIVAIHGTMLRTGNVLVWDEENTTTHPRVWDPAAGTFVSTPAVADELWCAGNISLSNGNTLSVGGHRVGAGEVGISSTYQYDPLANKWTKTGNLAYPRWYPALTGMTDGRVAIVSGQIDTGTYADALEIYAPATGKLTTVSAVQTSELREEEYPIDFPLPDGRILAISPQWGPVQVLDPLKPSWSHVTTTPIILGSAVQYRPGKILMSGGGNAFESPSSTLAAVLDMNEGSPQWRQISSMSLGRYMHTLVMLPTGKVLAIGGADVAFERISTGPLPVEQWDPDTELWTTLAAMSVPRYYHSIAMLLPDGRVLAAGGGHNSGWLVDQFSGQVYSPPYLFKGARPTISAAPDSLSYGTTFTVSTPLPSSIASVSLISLPSATHSTQMGQLYRELAFTAGSSLTITPPASANEAPPGYYMLFIVDTNGVPSVAKILTVGGGSSPTPPVAPNAPSPADGATGVATNTSLTWSASGATTYDLNFGTSNPPGLSASGLTAATATPSGLAAGVTYYWQVIARNSGGSTTGPVWQFTTAPTIPPPPGSPANPSPASGATNVATNATLTWTAAGATSYDLKFGTANPPPLLTSGLAAAAATPGGMIGGTTYFWQVVAHNSGGATTGPVWSFATGAAPPPTAGLTTVGAMQDSGDSNYLNGSRITSPSIGHIVSMSVYVGPVDSTAANRLCQVALYTDNAGKPGTLVASSASATLTANAWNTVAISAAVQANTPYWLIYNTNGRSAGVNEMYFNTASAGEGVYSSGKVTFGTWPATFPAATVTDSQFSLFGTLGP